MSKRKRRFSAEFKAEVVLTVLTGEKSQAEVCREHQLSTPSVWQLEVSVFREYCLCFREAAKQQESRANR